MRKLAELMGHSDLSQVTRCALSDEKKARAGVTRLWGRRVEDAAGG